MSPKKLRSGRGQKSTKSAIVIKKKSESQKRESRKTVKTGKPEKSSEGGKLSSNSLKKQIKFFYFFSSEKAPRKQSWKEMLAEIDSGNDGEKTSQLENSLGSSSSNTGDQQENPINGNRSLDESEESFKDLSGNEPNLDDEEDTEPRSRKEYVWTEVNKLASASFVQPFIDGQKIWSKKNRKICKNVGVKQYYRCNQVKKGPGKCPAEIYLFYYGHKSQVGVFTNNEAHVHQKEYLAIPKLCPEVKKFIEDAVERGEVKNAIRVGLKDTFGAVPSNNAIQNTIQKTKKLLFSDKLNIGEIQEFCEQNMEVPGDANDVFVLDHFQSDLHDGEPSFRYLMSTTNLLKNAAILNHNICSDATYSMNLQGLPVIVMGSLDKAKKFHLLAFGFTTNKKENTDDYRFCFQTLKKSVENIVGIIYNPSVLVADGDVCIHTAFKEIFGEDGTIKMCFVHMIRNVKRHLSAFGKNKTIRKELLDDIMCIQRLTSKESFAKGCELFFKKWKKSPNYNEKMKTFLDYFKSQWIENMCWWYEGYLFGDPSTTNGVEGMNSCIKRVHTNHLIKNYPEMHILFLKYIRSFSINGLYDDSKVIHLEPIASPELRREAYALCVELNCKKMFYSQTYNNTLKAVVFRQGSKKWLEEWEDFDQIRMKNQDNNFQIVVPGILLFFFYKN